MKRPTCLLGLKEIGKGANSRCYKLNNREVLLVSTDPVKEAISNKWFINSRLLPKIEYYDYCRTYGYKIYKMPLYKKLCSYKKLNRRDTTLYLELTYIAHLPQGNTEWLKDIIDINITCYRTKKCLIDCINLLQNYGSEVRLDFCNRNLSVSNSGRLILRDIFYVEGYEL